MRCHRRGRSARAVRRPPDAACERHCAATSRSRTSLRAHRSSSGTAAGICMGAAARLKIDPSHRARGTVEQIRVRGIDRSNTESAPAALTMRARPDASVDSQVSHSRGSGRSCSPRKTSVTRIWARAVARDCSRAGARPAPGRLHAASDPQETAPMCLRLRRVDTRPGMCQRGFQDTPGSGWVGHKQAARPVFQRAHILRMGQPTQPGPRSVLMFGQQRAKQQSIRRVARRQTQRQACAPRAFGPVAGR